jgi:hypothetical protein
VTLSEATEKHRFPKLEARGIEASHSHQRSLVMKTLLGSST